MWKQKIKTEKQIVFLNETTGEECVASHVYTHKDLGEFYMFDSLLTMPFQRKYVFDLIQQNEKIGIEKPELTKYIENIKELIKNQSKGFDMEIFRIVSYVEAKLKDSWDYQKSSLMAVALTVVQDGDNINGFNQSDAEAKLNLWTQDPTMLAFFLNFLQLRLSSLTNMLDTSSRTYSETLDQLTAS